MKYNKNKYTKEIEDFCKENYPKFKGNRVEFLNILSNKFGLNITYNSIKRLKLSKKRILKRKNIVCSECKKNFEINLCYIHKKFCSKKCYGESRKGKYPLNIKRNDWKKALLKNIRNGLYKRNSERMKNGGALKARLANRVSPNKPERFMIKIIDENNLPFNYVGNSRFWIKGKNQYHNPDFINKKLKLIIEIFGKYWHDNPKSILRDKQKFLDYSEKGYKTLVVWDYELKNPNFILNKIKRFK